jgi:UDP-N-acetylglucosamine 2-epimerase (non-hydrolysing)
MASVQPTIIVVAGARPNYMKVAPVVRALEERAACRVVLVHTGQHYDPELSDVFFRDLSLRQPDVFLAVGSASHAVQTARVMERFEPVVVEHRPAVVVVVGDVNSTIACALTASKITYAGGTRPLVAHVEAGLRSNDWSMPEEVNRVLTDRLSDLLLTPSADADENLLREGIQKDRIHCVGNVMIDSVLRLLPSASKRWSEISDQRSEVRASEPQRSAPQKEQELVSGEAAAGAAENVLSNAECGVPGHPGVEWKDLGIKEQGYALVTLHRPSNVDDSEVLRRIMSALEDISASIPILFPVHPRTRSRLETLAALRPSLEPRASNLEPQLHLLPPLGYLDFLALERHAAMVLTDSGGVQEETTALGVPCLTLRENTERPVTVTEGTNLVVGTDPGRMIAEARRVLRGEGKKGRVPAGWDGKAGERIADVLLAAVAQK